VSPRRAATTAAALAGAALAAVAQEAPAERGPAEVPGRHLEEVAAGFDGAVLPEALSPVWVTLTNPGEAERELAVVARSGDAIATRAVQLPAGARKRVCLAIEVTDELAVELREGGEGGAVVESRVLDLVDDLVVLDPERHLLALDGRPPEQRTRAATRREDPALRVTSADAASAPTEAPTYRSFGAVLLRGVDLEALRADQRAALLEHVREGGTLVFSAGAATDPAAERAFAAIAGPEERTKLAGRVARIRRHGLGRAIAFEGDVLGDAFGRTQGALLLRTELGQLVEDGRSDEVSYPRVFEQLGPGLGGVGQTTKAVILGFFVAYLLAVGPVLGLALRKATRRKLAVATCALIGVFALLAPGVAGVVRTGAGVAFARTVLWVPPEGPAVELGDVTVASGGAASYDLELTAASGPVAATRQPPDLVKEQVWRNGWRLERARPSTVRTWRGDEVTAPLALSPWGRQSVATQVVVPGVPPLEAVLRRRGSGYLVEVHNTTGAVLEGVLIVEEGWRPEQDWNAYVEVGDLAPGERASVPVGSGGGGFRYGANGWADVLDVPRQWTSWTRVRPLRTSRDQAPLRYLVVSRLARGRVQAGGPNLSAVAHALRVDPVQSVAGLSRGYVGLVVESVGQDVYGEVRVARVVPGGPAAAAGVPPGAAIMSVDGESVGVARDFRRLVGRQLPGDVVSIGLWDPNTGRQWSVSVELVGRHQVPEGD